MNDPHDNAETDRAMLERFRRPTPGPWRYDGGDTVYFPGRDGRVLAVAYADRLADETWEDSVRVGEANARLIAAAPDLLEAAQEAAQALQQVEDEEDPHTMPSPLLQSIRAAIARATGQES